ncbi:spore germination protein GerPC [Paenibacillus hamazuiensis]|uniref:spore germination protein GerPC n=1 Tax=Paenibacillus hamazuiensis TaxID=2936508 RepID=UPI00200C8677|nr:spore germination protein GerPC [Paenibacillus hamazuiensis]
MNGDPFRNYYEQLNAYLKWQTDQIIRLEQKYSALQREVEQLKQQKAIRIDRIEYKFDQLKVETLEGTLNIGISPNGGKTIEDMAVNGEPVGGNQDDPEMFARLERRTQQYLDEECPADIQAMEARHQLVLGKDNREFIVEDIRGQIEQRIWHYVTQHERPQNAVDPQQAEDAIFEQIKSDIRTAVDRYLQTYKSKGGNGA